MDTHDALRGDADEIEINGFCMGCGAFGILGQPCTNVVCDRFELHFVPNDEPGIDRDNNDPMVGRRIDEFLIVELIGRGGFGKVYRALFGDRFARAAALKFLSLPEDERIRATMPEKFALEAQVLRTLDHPNVVGLIAHRTEGSNPYIAMEYMPNSITLREDVIRRIRNGAWYDERQVRGILVQILDALEAAHLQGVVHRDVKPENVLLQYGRGEHSVPRVKLVDFGTAKILAESGGVTQMALGSPSYMAPEQFELENLGTWTDVYAAAVVAFELFAEKKPFPGEDDRAILKAKFDPAFDPFEAVKLVPEIESVLRRALAEEPQYRFRDAGQFRRALLQVLDWSSEGLLMESEIDEASEAEETRIAPYESLTREFDTRPRAGRIPTPTPYSRDGQGLWGLPALPPASRDEDATPTYEFELYEESAEVEPAPTDPAPAPKRSLRLHTDSTVARLIPDGRAWRAISLMLALLTLIVVLEWKRGPAPQVAAASTAATPLAVAKASSGDEKRAIGRAFTFDSFTCVLEQDGELACRGAAPLFAPQADESSDTMRWRRLAGPVIDIDTVRDEEGREAACIVFADGNVRCWGYNGDGRLGYGHKKAVHFDEIAPQSGYANVPTRRSARALAMASEPRPTTCVALDDGMVRCWSAARNRRSAPPDHDEFFVGGPVVELVATEKGFCARTDVGTVTCWDAGAALPEPQPVALQHAATQLVAGDHHVCALDEVGDVSCWGSNRRSELGMPGSSSTRLPVPVPTRGPVVQLSAGDSHTCARLADGPIRCWGDNREGQLGVRPEPPLHRSSLDTSFVSLDADVASVIAGGDHSCAVLADDRLVCWGERVPHLEGARRLGALPEAESVAARPSPR